MRLSPKVLPPAPLFLAAGVALSLGLHAPLWAALCAAAVAAAAWRTRLGSAALLLALVAAGLWAGGQRVAPPARGPLYHRVAAAPGPLPVWVRGAVQWASTAPEGCRAVVRVEAFLDGEAWVADGTLARCFLPVPPPAEGSRLEASLQLSLPREATNPGQFDPKEWLARGGVALRGLCRDPELLRLAPPEGLSPVARYRAALRERLLACTGGEGGAALAMLLGDRGLLSPSDEEDLVRSGLYHLVALSGTHVALLLVLLSAGAHLLGLHPRTRDLGGAALALLYGLLVGPVPSLGRAVLMGVLFLAARVVDRPRPAAEAWCAALAGLLLYDPQWLLDAGFQLTFAATLGMILLAGARPPLPGWAARAEWLWSVLWLGLSAQLFALPFLVHDFHRLSPAGLLATPLASLPMFLVLGAGVPLLAGGAFVPGVAEVLGWVVARGVGLFLILPRWLGERSGTSLFLPEPWAGWTLLYLAALGLLLLPGRRAAGWVALGALMVGVWAAPRPFDPVAPPSLTVLDVGQASCQVLEGAGATILVDCGEGVWRGPGTARTVVEPFLAAAGVRRVDGVVLTHWDSDHAGALGDLLLDLPVGFVGYPATDPPGEGSPREVAALCARRGVPLVPLGRGAAFHGAGFRWSVLHPGPGEVGAQENDRSLVVRVEAGEVALLFTGDLERGGEASLLASGATLSAHALLVPHHGSKTSSTTPFVAAVAPRLALVSAGPGNRFGHPAPGVVARYQASGALLLRTDRDGAVVVSLGPGRPVWRRTRMAQRVSGAAISP